jgi:hypothetical protein
MASICAALLVGTFFMPWENLGFVRLSGFGFQQMAVELKLFWLMPILAAITLISGLAGKSMKIPGQLAGATPFFILIYALKEQGMDLLQALAPGGWAALVLGTVLFILVRR